MLWGMTIDWTAFSGTKHSVSVNGCATFREAVIECYASALAYGWKHPKWWQVWRRNDWRPTMEQKNILGLI